MSKILAIHACVEFANPMANALWLRHQLQCAQALAPALVVTPELTLTGYPMLEQRLPWDANTTAEAIDLVARTVDELGVSVLLGTLYFGEAATTPTNALILLEPGKRTLICEKHRQKMIPAGHGLAEDYAYGTTRRSFEAAGLRCAPLICAESLDPDIVTAVKALQPGLVVHPSAWGSDAGEPYARTAARESLFQEELVLVVNQTGDYLGDWPHAESFLYQNGEVLALAKGPQPQWLFLETSQGGDAGHPRVHHCRVLPAAA